eukprot:COSAG01_NODE_27827_length_676_cov_0.580589_1_plen_157_part_00
MLRGRADSGRHTHQHPPSEAAAITLDVSWSCGAQREGAKLAVVHALARWKLRGSTAQQSLARSALSSHGQSPLAGGPPVQQRGGSSPQPQFSSTRTTMMTTTTTAQPQRKSCQGRSHGAELPQQNLDEHAVRGHHDGRLLPASVASQYFLTRTDVT